MGVGGQLHALAALPPGMTRYPLYRRLGGPQDRSGRLRKISPPPGFDPRTVQPVASHYPGPETVKNFPPSMIAPLDHPTLSTASPSNIPAVRGRNCARTPILNTSSCHIRIILSTDAIFHTFIHSFKSRTFISTSYQNNISLTSSVNNYSHFAPFEKEN